MLTIASSDECTDIDWIVDAPSIVAAARAAGFRATYYLPYITIEQDHGLTTTNTNRVFAQISQIILAYAGSHAAGQLAFVDKLEIDQRRKPSADHLAVRATYMGGEMYTWNLGVDGWRGHLHYVMRAEEAYAALMSTIPGCRLIQNRDALLVQVPGESFPAGHARLQPRGEMLANTVAPFLRIRGKVLKPVIHA